MSVSTEQVEDVGLVEEAEDEGDSVS